MLRIGLALLSLAALLPGQAGEPTPPQTPPKTRAEVGAALAQALAAGGSQAVAALRAAAAAAADALPPDSRVRAALVDATAGVDDAAALRRNLQPIADDLRFAPLLQAPTPAAWPQPTPVGEIEVKTYPAYRMARAAMRGGQMGAFWPLFRHIQQREIPMTAPVQIDYSLDGDREQVEASMAFLYQSPDVGQTGKANAAVEVVDVPAATVLSIGARGRDTSARIDDLLAELEAWLRQHRATHAATGPMRVMGWNSPTVPDAQRYFEVQVPVRRRVVDV